ncbi:MAG TPA: hypothetical protein VFB43_07265 [Terracidiphilus sp.]|nr:hypothetical protein [Terracidiphilus sp.]
MELLLNLAWLLLAFTMAGLWLRFSPNDTGNRRAQFVALALLLFILLPAISVTDDLLAAQNPAEIDSCLRRDHEFSGHHGPLLLVAILPVLFHERFTSNLPQWAIPGATPLRISNPPALSAIQNRPPPVF